MPYRASTESELRRYGVPHRIVGSPWYRSSNTACVYPLPPPPHDWRDEVRRRRAAELRALAKPSRDPLKGDGENTAKVIAESENSTGEQLKVALAEARYYDWLDQRRTALMQTSKSKRRPSTAKPLDQILIDEGFVANRYLLDINRSLQVSGDDVLTDPWNLPSRLMQHPLEVGVGKDGQFHIGLMHPLLGDHPFVQRVAKAIHPHKISPAGAPNAFGHSAAPACWWHAVDLIRTHWQDLLRTREFTTDHAIAGAVSNALGSQPGAFGLDEAREVLAAIGAEPPVDDIAATVLLLSQPSLVQPDKGAAYWPINGPVRNPVAGAWLRLWGIDAGWFDYMRSGHLVWSAHGRGMYRALAQNAAG